MSNTGESAVTVELAVYAVRRANLRELINSKYEGNRSRFARETGKNVNLINLTLTSNPDLRRNVGEKLARDIEAAAGLPHGWMDVDRTEQDDAAAVVAIPRMRAKRGPRDMIPEALYCGAKWLSSTYSSDPKQLFLYHMPDDTMAPTIQPGDVVIIDGEVTAGDGLFLAQMAGDHALRRIQRRPDGSFSVRCDNQLYDATVLDAKKAKATPLMGRAVGLLRHVSV